MSVRTLAHALSIAVLAGCVLFSYSMAYGGFENSQATGAGAAQAEVGFFMILQLVTPVLLGLTAIALAAGLCARPVNGLSDALRSPVLHLSLLSVAMIGWNWFFLFQVWL